MNLLENGIWERIREGDVRSFKLLFDTYNKGLINYASDLIRKKEDAEEIILDMFASLWDDRESIHIKTNLKAYLYRSVHNRCINFIKKRHSDLMKSNDLVAEFILVNQQLMKARDDCALENLIVMELEKEVESAIATLPGQCREVFYLSRFDQMKIKDIANTLNVSESTVKTQLIRAVDKLRIILGHHLK
jgi:RNA polymerase sigma-70 factor, ECF subfamily